MKHFTFKQCALAALLMLASPNWGQLAMAGTHLTNLQDDRPAITVQSGELRAENAVTIGAPLAVDYRKYDLNGEYASYGYGIEIQNVDPSMFIRVQLADPSNPNGVKLGYLTGESSSTEKVLDGGGFWSTPDECMRALWGGTDQRFWLQIYANKPCDVTYTVSVYATRDLSTEPLDSCTSTLHIQREADTVTIGAPLAVDYRKYDLNGEYTSYGYGIKIQNVEPSMFIRVQLADPSNPNGVKLGYLTGESSSTEKVLDGGGFWSTPDECMRALWGPDQRFWLLIYANKPCDVTYTVSVYATRDLNTEPLDSCTSTLHILSEADFPTLNSGVNMKVIGELNKDVTLPVKVTNAGFLTGKKATLRLWLTATSGEEFLSINSDGWSKESAYNNVYLRTIDALASQADYSLIVRATDNVTGEYGFELLDEEGVNITGISNGSFQIPFAASTDDISALTKLASDNPSNNDLRTFVEQKLYAEDNKLGGNVTVATQWNAEIPARISYFGINDSRTHTVKNLEAIKSLTELEILNLTSIKAENLDLSGLSNLRELDLWSTSFTWGEVTLPQNEQLNIHGSTYVSAGTPINDYEATASNGVEIDLSAFSDPNGVASTYQWYQEVQTGENSYSGKQIESMPTVSGRPGVFIMKGTIGEKYWCEVSNTQYKNWHMRTPLIKVVRGSDDYCAADTLGLRALANANPKAPLLKEFVDTKGWENENWDNWRDNIRTDWRMVDGQLRLTHLLIAFDWNSTDTITALDLSSLSELTYFDCEQYMNISALDLSNNTKLEYLHIYSEPLKSIDLSHCPNLIYFGFGTRNSTSSDLNGIYARNQLSSINMTGCTKLQKLYLEHVHLKTLDLSGFSNLISLHVENCQDLSISNLAAANQLSTLELPYTTQFASLLTQLPASVCNLFIQNTTYAMPSASIGANLIRLGIPKTASKVDLAEYPNLQSLDADGSLLKFSGIENYRKISYNGSTTFELKSPSHTDQPDVFEEGDTINLSSEASFNGVNSVFVWVNARSNIEETDLFVPVEGKSGVFVISKKPEDEGNVYWCKIMNTQFGSITEINVRSGWQMRTSFFHVNTEKTQEITFHEGDVQALGTIVNNSTNPELKNWFSSEGWKTNGDTDLNAYGWIHIEWSDEPTKRLTSLSLIFMDELLSGTVDVSTLDRLEYLELPFTNVSGVKLPTNPEKLKWLNLCDTKVTTLDVSAYTNLLHLNVQNSALKSCDLSKNTQLERLQLGGTTVTLNANTVYPNMTYFMTADNIASLDLNQMPNLETLVINNDQLKFSNVKNAHKLSSVSGDSYLTASDVVYQDVSMVAKEAVLDFSKEIATGATISDLDSLITTSVSGQYQVDWKKAKLLCIDLTNDMFPGWTLHYPMSMLTEKGDVNYDEKVNVQDVTATAAHLVDLENQLEDYSLYAGDVNENEEIDAGDMVGIVNIIMNKPFTKSSELRAAYRPTVDVQMDEKNFLTMENEVPVAALYLEIAGANAETALLADAARLMQASSLKDDTLRIVAYSLDGHTIASGKHILAQLQPGMRIVKATFSDAQAALLQTTGDLLSTANETITPEVEAKAIYNYPNPTAGQTTFCYALAQPAQSVEVQFFASNGAFVARLQGLPTASGSQSYSTTLPLSAGVYYYRLVIDGKQVTATNTLIIK